jgi:two-component system response regulator YesN
VDDEQYAVDALVKAVDWKALRIGGVYSSNYYDETIDILLNKKIDLLICDISMQERSGFEIVKFIKENGINTYVIMLTAHANFEYAKQAITLDVMEYLLKPVKPDALIQAVNKVIARMESETKRELTVQLYEKGYDLWKRNIPLVVERFWRDVFERHIYLDGNKLTQLAKNSDFPISPSTEFLIVLISLDEWDEEEWPDFEEEILLYAIRNIAGEVILEGVDGSIIQDFYQNNLCVVYCNGEKERGNTVEIIERQCKKFIEYCNMYLKIKLCCYISSFADMRGVVNEYNNVLKLYEYNLTEENAVINSECGNSQAASEQTAFSAPEFLDITNPLENIAKEQLLREIEIFFNRSGKHSLDNNTMVAHGLLFFIYNICVKKGVNAADTADISNVFKSLNSTYGFRKWCLSAVDSAVSAVDKSGQNSKITDIKRYIEAHYKENITRESIANDLFFNGYYLSRLFKQNTGMSIFEYLFQVRINEAKRLLLNTDKKISDIVFDVGYNHFSHFANTFKKHTGLTPKSFRELNKK